MRVWVDCTAAPHPLVLRPIIHRLAAAGHEVTVTAREYGQTTGILRRLGIPFESVGSHGGASRRRKLAGLVSRSAHLGRTARRRRYDLAIGHGSVDLSVVARFLGIPAVTMFDYEWASLQHHINCRASRRVLTPDAIPTGRLRRYGARDGKLDQYPGLKEEYYLADFEPDPSVLDELGVDREKVLCVLRPPSAHSMYHVDAPLHRALLDTLAVREDVCCVLLPRTAEQQAEVRSLGSRSLIVPERVVDGQSLIAHADVVLGGGGTMNREAAALGTPVYTTFAGRPGAVDERLLREGRLRTLEDPSRIELRKRRAPIGVRETRDPAELVHRILAVLG